MAIPIPKIGMGTQGMGGKFADGRFRIDPQNRIDSLCALQTGLDLGLRLIDTAELYGDGVAEEIVGEAIRNHSREKLFIVSKVWKDNLRYPNLIKSAKESLRRLGTSYVDFYLIHWPNPEIPLAETMTALEDLMDQGLIRSLGVSNFTVPLLVEAQKYLRKAKIAANEIYYNLLDRSAEKEIIPFCKSRGIKIIAARPLAKGELCGNHHPALNALSQKYEKTPAQIALNWIMAQEIVPIPKTTHPLRVKENWGATGWTLNAEDIQFLNQ